MNCACRAVPPSRAAHVERLPLGGRKGRCMDGDCASLRAVRDLDSGLSDLDLAHHSGVSRTAILGPSGAGKTSVFNALTHTTPRVHVSRAILGPSGAGKTSVFNALTNTTPRARGTRLMGRLRALCAAAPGPYDDVVATRMAYVPQKQAFYPFLTVRETLLFTAGMRMGGTGAAEKEEYVAKLLVRLGMEHAADTLEYIAKLLVRLGMEHAANTLVGDPTRTKSAGISGGEQRRLALGLGVIGLEKPSVLLVDEPTSGLDASQAQKVIEALRALCEDGHTVAVTIHQPRSSIFALIDDVLLIAQGEVMYMGPAEQALPHFQALGYSVPPQFNPADFLLDLVSPGALAHGYASQGSSEANQEDEEHRLRRFALAAREAWRQRPADIDDDGDACASAAAAAAADGIGDNAVTVPPNKGRVGALTQFRLLLVRSWRQVARNSTSMLARLATGIALGGFFGAIFWDMGGAAGAAAGVERAAHNRISLAVNVCINAAMIGSIGALQTLAVEKPVVMRERLHLGYGALPYYLAKFIAELPLMVLFPLSFAPMVHGMARLGHGTFLGGIGEFVGMVLLQTHASAALGLMVGCVSPNMDTAMVLGPALNVIFLMLSGVHGEMPEFLKKMEWLSTMKWGVEGVIRTELQGARLESTFVPSSASATTSLMGGGGGGAQHGPGWWGRLFMRVSPRPVVIKGEQILEKLGYPADGGLQRPATWLAGLACAYHVITVTALALAKPHYQLMEPLPERCPVHVVTAAVLALAVSHYPLVEPPREDASALASSNGTTAADVLSLEDVRFERSSSSSGSSSDGSRGSRFDRRRAPVAVTAR
ncbi:hypothetical protein JKP88DRAFT_346958 [Tribonema minus]|uniref:ABC transporter domain-containing protein n=1 Tax=Tribonema minus TaxID=303371 RepID=A0A836C9P6_9STRA|nr:hypothetical protein JKP88DRAFT_346958 [Tribonema minus]